MRKSLIVAMCVLALAVFGSLAWAQSDSSSQGQQPQTYYGPGQGQGYGRGMGPGMMGQGYGPGMGGPGMMGQGYGPGMGQGYGMGQAWQNLSPQDRQELQKMFQEHRQSTLKLRQEFVTKHMELETLWAQPKPDQTKIRALSKDLSEIQGKLSQDRDEFLLQCRQKFGDKGWSCPGGGY
ncbi:MAG: periplasmic heavy metal sensor [Proteobacteria bacterium]|nr:periplasmic heavy metal sensor [Pseudomonadota bacterium]MBU4385253.1 periplasmic heavy metal sensor [Pseudomonadota bacterium]MBU4605612.1 periplasmic heavy metal sensor [Pseudomonadota bacterium]MCG2764861.1 periplasmic heavy metal sensor [Desulfarculaceae bacterium]